MAEPEKKKNGRLVYRIILIVLLSLFVGTSVYTINARQMLHDAMPMPFGIGTSVVLSGSMEPTLSVNDLVVVCAREEYQVGDVVVYQSGSSLIIHRILELGEDYAVTRGDANNTEDAPIPLDSIKGRMVFAVPYVGIAVHFLQSIPGALIVIALAVFLMNRSWSRERADDDRQLDQIKDEIRRLKAEEESRAELAAEEKTAPAAAADTEKQEEHLD